eukprot:gb/GFBE01020064.1/.p1 GENE.gb/GFBE01020064.1/~~gb/GFBE01020064.1/.p1  ORF type:complete len:439 (+),score=124.72 gb/GFBE01020064.1/:1-1317(+)
MAQDEHRAEDEEDEQQRKNDFLQFRRQLDGMREEKEGEETQANKLKTQGNHFFSFGCYGQAAMMYSEALDLKPQSTVLLNNRAMAYLKQGMTEEALADADRSIEIDASVENIKAFWRRAQALLDLERDEEAEQAANAGIALQANNGHLNRVRKKAREAATMRRLCGVDWVGKLENGVEKKFSFTKEGSMTMTVIGHALEAKFDLSVECTPQSMVVKMQAGPMTGSAPPPPVPYIYEFHDNDQELWICHPVGSTELPSKFAGPGFSKLRRVEQAKPAGGADAESAEPLDKRCARYMREFNQILPLMPPQLPERPSEEQVGEEVLLMEKVHKLKQRFGLEVHQRAMELAKAPTGAPPADADAAELAELAAALRERLVARKVLPASAIAPAAAPEATPLAPAADAGNKAAEATPELCAVKPQQQGLFSCLGGVAARFCGGS